MTDFVLQQHILMPSLILDRISSVHIQDLMMGVSQEAFIMPLAQIFDYSESQGLVRWSIVVN